MIISKLTVTSCFWVKIALYPIDNGGSYHSKTKCFLFTIIQKDPQIPWKIPLLRLANHRLWITIPPQPFMPISGHTVGLKGRSGVRDVYL